MNDFLAQLRSRVEELLSFLGYSAKTYTLSSVERLTDRLTEWFSAYGQELLDRYLPVEKLKVPVFEA